MGVRPGTRGCLSADERELLDGLVEQLGPRLLAYISRVYGNLHDAEDIVAEAYCRAATNIRSLQESNRQDLYLLTIARNLCRDRYRKRTPNPVPNERLQACPDAQAEPHELVSRDERARALRAAVAELPENLREVVVLRMSTELKFEEIATLLGVPLGTALSRMHTAVRHLREMVSCAPEQ